MSEPGEGDEGRKILGLSAGCDPTALQLNPAEGFLLSRIDGQTPWRLLREIGGLMPEEVDLCLETWLARGIVDVAGLEEKKEPPPSQAPPLETRSERSRDGGAPPAPHEPPEAIDESQIDRDLDLSAEVQRSILEFEARLHRPYHELLGVERNADVKQIKRAYFNLCKDYHPDRYFRRKIGDHAGRLDRIFKKILEAYELLSDPTTRAEVERSLDAVPPPPGGGPQRPLSKLERLRQRMPFKIPEAVMNERRAKAADFFDAARFAMENQNYVEAASSVRLAIAFDPFNDEYKKAFAEVQGKATEMRAGRLLEEAEGMDSSRMKEAYRLYEETLLYRPHDPAVNDKAAELALEMGELDKAFEYAERATLHSPQVGRYHRTLARVYRSKSDAGHAVRELQNAIELDPGDEEAKKMLDLLRPRRGARGGN
ncbi:MAG: DnaJ domain-containing protein [Proteobacteria bacterium]|nr:DnaJ domain-containing protein [Pseudomonadota bacterium]